jgi:hypothetical protein
MSNEEKNAKQRELRRRTGDVYTKKYEKTKKGFLMRCYRNMQSRVAGIQQKKAHLYAHIERIPCREDFYQWAQSSEAFNALFDQWEANAYNRKLSPSVDRIDPRKGYDIDNMRWITHSENSRLGGMSRLKNIRILDGEIY